MIKFNYVKIKRYMHWKSYKYSIFIIKNFILKNADLMEDSNLTALETGRQ